MILTFIGFCFKKYIAISSDFLGLSVYLIINSDFLSHFDEKSESHPTWMRGLKS